MPSLLVAVLLLMTLTCDLPWTPNFVVELQFIKSQQASAYVCGILVIFFWTVLMTYLIFSQARSNTLTRGQDLPVETLLLLVTLTLLPIGYVMPCTKHEQECCDG